jgi:polyisoprenoid-binding protein YceI
MREKEQQMSVATAVPTGAWTVDKVHSSVGFEVDHMVSTFRGHFEDYDVQLVDGRLEGTVRVPSVKVYDENLEAHLQSPDFFDSERYPELRFESRELTVDGDGSLAVEGELTIKGTTRPVTGRGRYVHVEADMGGGERIGLRLETTVDRREFGLDWNAPLPKGGFALGNDVTLVVALELTKAQA